MSPTTKEKLSKFWEQWRLAVISSAVTLVVVIAIAVIVGLSLLRYYVGGLSINRRAIGAPLRSILWEEPKMLPGLLNQVRGNHDATISGDNKTIIITRRFSPTNTDLFISKLDSEKGWSKPLPIRNVNSIMNEKNPELSRDGSTLFFSSNRPGGKGGYDIWASLRTEDGWTKPVLLKGEVNSDKDDIDPALSKDGKLLFFSSNRPLKVKDEVSGKISIDNTRTDFNIYRGQVAPDSSSMKVPDFTLIKDMKVLNTSFDERKTAFTHRGDMLYFSSNRPGGIGGFDLYSSYFIEGRFMKPRNFGTPVNSEYDEISPTLSMEGFGLYFCSNRHTRDKTNYKVYNTISREVVAKVDYESFLKMILALLLIIATLVAIFYLLKLLLSDTNMKTIYKCLLASIVVHMIILVICAFWFITAKIGEVLTPAPPELTINVNNLARESVAMSIRESLSSLPKVNSSSSSERMPVPQKSEPVQQKSNLADVQPSVVKASISNIAMKPVKITSGRPSSPSEAVPVPRMSHIGANVKMELPTSGGSEGQSDEQDGATEGLPGPGKPRVTKKVEVKDIEIDQMPMPIADLNMPDPQGEIGKETWEPAVKVAMIGGTTAGKARSKEGDDPTVDRIISAGPSSPKSGMPDSVGTLLFDSGAIMESAKPKPDDDDYILGLLSRDPNITQALNLNVNSGEKIVANDQKIIDYILINNLIEYDPIKFIKVLMKSKLKPVGGLIYSNLPGLRIPVDSELEVPEHFAP